MLSKRCNRCGRRVAVGRQCNCYVPHIYKPASTDKYTDELKRFYHTADWLTARDECISRCYGIDIYSLFERGVIEYGFTVHHIIPLTDDYSRRLDPGNLIYLTESNHRLIHKLYQTEREQTIGKLRGYVEMFGDKYI
ncbi:MAG: hypothetical protein J6K77_07515 [Ruminococcus sp.]|nr:hypothetical protein [Ruminococcus sp.]